VLFRSDGFPRTLPQAQELEKFAKITDVVVLDIEEKNVIKRLSSRIQCRSCSGVFNTMFRPPKKSGICDNCGGELYTRDDDKPAAIKTRLNEYYTKTAPLIDFYKAKGLVHDVDANPNDAEKVCLNVEAALKI
jgi:adenylate kinase